jgi:uncharacterized membrane protein YidH (DUF202 family)
VRAGRRPADNLGVPTPVNADDSARMRDLLASNRTLLAWIRTALSFAGLGFVVAKFGRNTDMIRFAGALGTFLVVIGLAFTIMGYLQHRATLMMETPPPGAPEPTRWPAIGAFACCAVVCAALAVYIGVST